MKLPHFSPFPPTSKSCLPFVIACLLVVAAPLSLLTTSTASEPLAKGIQDNSFLIEEAYNQEPGVVQHILNVPISFTNGSREIAPSFTQEWPIFSQTHQFSYTIPYVFTEDDNGLADMRLNYRLQALTEDEYTPAFAPRFLWCFRPAIRTTAWALASWVMRPICLSARSSATVGLCISTPGCRSSRIRGTTT
jgi:hypothetical protein